VSSRVKSKGLGGWFKSLDLGGLILVLGEAGKLMRKWDAGNPMARGTWVTLGGNAEIRPAVRLRG